jgi:hypothetical protein
MLTLCFSLVFVAAIVCCPASADTEWTTYTNEEFKFEFQYPTGWDLSSTATNRTAFNSLPIVGYHQFIDPDGTIRVAIHVLDNSSRTDLESFFTAKKEDSEYVIAPRIEKVNGLKYKQVLYAYDPPAFDVLGYEAQTMIEFSSDLNVYIQVTSTEGVDCREVLEKVVSSFKRANSPEIMQGSIPE